MENKWMLLIMDLLVLGALGITMYYMRNLYASIKVIREGKTELQQLLQQLNIHVSNAQHAIENMQKLADDKAKTIQKQIDNAGSAIEELQFIQRAADNVAQRLEKLTGSTAQNAPLAAKPEMQITGTKPPRNVSKAEKELADAIARRTAKAGE